MHLTVTEYRMEEGLCNATYILDGKRKHHASVRPHICITEPAGVAAGRPPDGAARGPL